MINAGTLTAALRHAECTTSEIQAILRDVSNGRHGVKRLRDEFAMEVLAALVVRADLAGAENEHAATVLDSCVKWAYWTADLAMKQRDEEPSA